MLSDRRWETRASFNSAPKESAPAMILRGLGAAAAAFSAMVHYELTIPRDEFSGESVSLHSGRMV